VEKIKKVNLRSEEEKAKKKKQKRRVLTLGLLAAVSVLGIASVFYIQNKKSQNYNAFEVVDTIDLTGTGTSNYMSYKSGMLKYSRDGVEAISADGKVLWNVGYNMKDPIADVNGSYVAVADRGSKTLYIIDGSGTANEISLLYSIVDVDVAAQGITAVLTNNGKEDHIYLYGADTKDAYVDINTKTESDGYPIDIALSDDGTKLVTSYLAMNQDELVTWLSFYNFSEVGKNYIDNLVGSYSFESVIPEVSFINNDLICAYRDDGFLLYSMKESPSVLVNETFSDQVISVFSDSSHIGFIFKNSGEESKYQMKIYDTSGKVLLNKGISTAYEKVYISGQEIVMYDKLECSIYNVTGELKFHSEFQKNAKFIYNASDFDRYIVVGDDSMDVIKLIQKEK